MNNNDYCECQGWCGWRDSFVLTGHHERCPNRNKSETEGAKELIFNLVRGIEYWAAETDGVPEKLWEDYKKAKTVIGEYNWSEKYD